MMIKKYVKYVCQIPNVYLIILLVTSIITSAMEAIKLYTKYGNGINDILVSDIILVPCLIVIMLKCSSGKILCCIQKA